MQAVWGLILQNVKASIIIPVKDDMRALRAVDSLKKQNLPSHEYEIIVVENGSHCLEEIFRHQVKYCRIKESSMPMARNKGLRIAIGKYVLFTDADCVAHKDWVSTMLRKLEEGKYIAVGGRIERYHPKTFVQRYGANLVNGQKNLNYLPALDYPYVVGANSAFEKEKLMSIRGFDNSLLSGNDVDVCYKLGLAGYTIGLAPDAVIYHDNRATALDHFKRFHHYARYQVLLFKKYRAISRKTYIVNPYPARLLLKSIFHFPLGVFLLLLMQPQVMLICMLDFIEALGVFCGDLHGAVEHRVPYL